MKSKRKEKPPLTSANELKFRIYEGTVQSPDWQVDNLPKFHRKLTGKPGLSMREDFCGTGKISCEWVKKSKHHRAVGLDICDETLEYANRVNKGALKDSVQDRVDFLKQDVLVPTREKFDMIGAHNFSVFIFHERAQMLKYARSAYRSLKATGTFFLEIAGGEGFVENAYEPQFVNVPGIGKVKYAWEQHQHDPIQAINDYSIHFQLPNGRWMNDAFTYHWRLWGIRELREILLEAGFRDTAVLWQTEDENGEGSSIYKVQEHAEHCETWLVYVVGIK